VTDDHVSQQMTTCQRMTTCCQMTTD
jgi:hypothetical protein